MSATGKIIGIDLGTTNSLVAVVENGVPRVLKPSGESGLLPSVITYDPQGGLRVGEGAKRDRVLHPKTTIFSTKRLLGRKLDDLARLGISLPYALEESGSEVKIRVGDRLLSPIDVAASILRELKARAERALGSPVSRAVVTVPAYFNDSQRQATRTAGRLAGLDIVRIINEPTAAALAYGWDLKRNGTIAVYDLGGGTFDLSILRLEDGVFDVLATRGDTALGGDDIDMAIADKLAGDDAASARADLELWATLLEEGERVKKQFATKSAASSRVEFRDRVFACEWTLPEFDELMLKVLERTRAPTVQALADAGLKTSDLNDVVLVGGPSRLPQVRKFVRELLGREPNDTLPRVGRAADQVADEVVALGAAIQGDILAGNRPELLLLDVVPLSLGIETYGGVTSVLIPRNSKVPASARESFTTYVDNQTGVDIHVVQGERDKVEDNRSLGKFQLKGIEPQPAGFPRIEVNFMVDADGILQVSAKDLKTGKLQAIEVRPSYGLSEAEIAERIDASARNAEMDIEFRRWVDTLTEVEPVLKAAEAKLPDARRLLEAAEVAQIEDKIQGLRRLIEQKDAQGVKNAGRALGGATQRLAELVLKEALNTASGKK